MVRTIPEDKEEEEEEDNMRRKRCLHRTDSGDWLEKKKKIKALKLLHKSFFKKSFKFFDQIIRLNLHG